MSSDSSKDVFDAIRHEHDELREKLGCIHHLLEDPSLQRDAIAVELSRLRAALETHFANEEREGFFDEISAQAPRLQSDTKRLSKEHVEMLSTARELVESVTTGSISDSWRRDLKSRFQEFSRQLMHHESDENSLLQRAFQEDIGSHD